jgi:hypothetical protein
MDRHLFSEGVDDEKRAASSRQPLFPLIESSLSMTATLYGVRGISRREAVRPIREDG